MTTNIYRHKSTEELQELRQIHCSHLHYLEVQAAKYGALNVPPHIAIQITELEGKITVLDHELQRRAETPAIVMSFRELDEAQWKIVIQESMLPPDSVVRLSQASLTLDYASTSLEDLAITCVDDLKIDGAAWDAARYFYPSGLTPLAMATCAEICGRKKDLPQLLTTVRQSDGRWTFQEVLNLAQIRTDARQRRQSGSEHTYAGTVVFDFASNALNAHQRGEIETILGEPGLEVIHIGDDSVDVTKPLLEEVHRLIKQLDPLPTSWPECRFIINPHPLATVSLVLMAELYGRAGELPQVIQRLKDEQGRWHVHAIINLHDLRVKAIGRRTRFVSDGGA